MDFKKAIDTSKKALSKGSTMMDLVLASILLVVLVVAVSVGSQILDQIQDTQTVNSTAYNVTGTGLTAMGDFADWFTTIVVIIVASFIIGFLLSRFLGGLGRGRR